MFVIAATTCMWYFAGQGSDNTSKKGTVSISLSFRWAILYHLGTMALGSFLIATMNFIKVIFEYFASKVEASGASMNPIVKITLWIARCFIWCVDCCIKLINKNAYIQVALYN